MVNFTMLVRNRPRLTLQALSSLTDTKDMTAMIRDDWSDPETWQIVEWFSDNNAIDGRVVYHAGRRLGTGGARNDVVTSSEMAFNRGDYLYLSDNDVFFTQGWLTKLISCYELAWSHGVRALGAYNHPFNQPLMELRFTNGMNVHTVNHLASQSMLMRWEVWDQYGPFIDTPVDKVCQSEDVVFSNKIREAGFKVGVVSPALIVNTGITNSFGEHIPGWEMVKAACPAGVVCE